MWSGGTYTKSNAGTGGWTGDAVAGIAIDATRHDTQDNDFATGINQCLTKDGQNQCTADLNFGGFRPSNVAGGSAAAPAYTANNDTDTGAFSPAANTYAIATGGVERVRVSSLGEFSVTSPGAILNVGSSSTSNEVCAVQIGVGRTASGGSLLDFVADTTYSDFGLRAIRNAGANGGSEINHRGTGNFNIACIDNASIPFITQNFERMRVTNAGTVQFRGSSNSSTFNTALCAAQIAYVGTGTEYGIGMRPATDVTTAILFQNAAGTSIGSIGTTAAATAFNTTSDYRLKNNVQPFPNGLTKVKALSPSQWEWSADNSEGFGFIAHELQAVIPEAVTGAKDAVDANGDPIYQAVDYGKLTTVLVAAVKELTAKVEALEAKVAILEGA